MGRNRDLSTDILVPDSFVRAVKQQRAPTLRYRLVQQRQGVHENIDLLGFERAHHGFDITGADPGDLVLEPHGFHVVGRPDMVGAAQ
jgi:hypothetical protein